MRIAVIQLANENYPMSHLAEAIQRAGMQPHVLTSDVTALIGFAGYVLVGKMSSDEDDAAALLTHLRAEHALGKPILGIAQGAKFLAEAGLVPGLANDRVGIAVTIHSKAVQQQQTTLHAINDFQYNAFTQFLSLSSVLSVVMPPAEFVIPSGLLMEMHVQGLCVLQDAACNAIAAVANKTGNVMAILPYIDSTLAESIFLSMRDYIAKGYVERVMPLYYQPRL